MGGLVKLEGSGGSGPAGLVWILAALFAGCGRGAPAEQGGGAGPPPTAVEIVEARLAPIREEFRAVGTLEAADAITIAAEIDAVVVSLPFIEGSSVRRGALLVELDASQTRAELMRAQAIEAQLRTTAERVRRLVADRIASPQDLDDAEAVLKVAKANVEVAETRLAKTRIVAPFGGMVGPRRVSPGAFVRAGDPIADLARIDEIKARFAAPERFLASIVVGTAVRIAVPSLPGWSVEGKVAIVDPILDPATRNARFLARVRNTGGRLRPGMSADVVVVLSERPSAITIPSEAVFFEGDQALAFVVGADGVVSRRELDLGARRADLVEVVQGLEPGASVVRAGHQKLFEGARVNPVPAEGR
jgi:membrane fusion protein (multidrug efflux system)